MARCRVSYLERRRHPFSRGDRTLYEAVAHAIVDFKQDKTITTPPGAETELTVVVVRKPAEHHIRLRRVQEWAQFSNTTGPGEHLRRERVRKMLMDKAS